MGKYFWGELLIPIFLTGLYLVIFLKITSGTRRWVRLGTIFATTSFITLLGAWISTSMKLMALQCQENWGDAGPKACDNPGEGFGLLIQTPVLFFFWIIISVAAFFLLKRMSKVSE
jgi:hypothetical protein